MKSQKKFRTSKKLFLSLVSCFSMTLTAEANAQTHSGSHEMQHNFVLSNDDKFGTHLVATGHHSRQTDIMGQLEIADQSEKESYEKQKLLNENGEFYFLFQAQSLDLPSIKEGQILNGHIVKSPIGKYETKNKIVSKAAYKVERILINLPNPFFTE